MSLVRQTFFKHFCAGETKEEVIPLMKRLEKFGVSGIMDYAAEEDVSAGPEGLKIFIQFFVTIFIT